MVSSQILLWLTVLSCVRAARRQQSGWSQDSKTRREALEPLRNLAGLHADHADTVQGVTSIFSLADGQEYTMVFTTSDYTSRPLTSPALGFLTQLTASRMPPPSYLEPYQTAPPTTEIPVQEYMPFRHSIMPSPSTRPQGHTIENAEPRPPSEDPWHSVSSVSTISSKQFSSLQDPPTQTGRTGQTAPTTPTLAVPYPWSNGSAPALPGSRVSGMPRPSDTSNGTVGTNSINGTGRVAPLPLQTPPAMAPGTPSPPPSWKTFSFRNVSWASRDMSASLRCMTALGGHTVYSIVYTTTETWLGDPASFSPRPTQLPPDVLPPGVSAPLPVTQPWGMTMLPQGMSDINGTFNWCLIPPEDLNHLTPSIYHCWASGRHTRTTCFVTAMSRSSIPAFRQDSGTATVLVTAKEPAVVLPPLTLPSYGEGGAGRGEGGSAAATPAPIDHSRAPPLQTSVAVPYYPAEDKGGQPGDSPGSPADENDRDILPGAVFRPTPVVVVQPGEVVINGETIIDSVPTHVVTVGGQAFTIHPSEVVGMGLTYDRPPLPTAASAFYAPTPTSAVLAGLPVVIAGSAAMIDGTTFALLAQPTAVSVHGGRTAYLGPGGVTVDGQTLSISPVMVLAVSGQGPRLNPDSGTDASWHTEVVVAGGDPITVRGTSEVVIRSVTLLYGSSGNTLTTTLDGEALTIGPGGVIVHGKTLGGPGAGDQDTQLEMVGGATFTEIGPSVVVLDGRTYTVGPARQTQTPSTLTTTAAGSGVSVTMGPGGVAVGSLTFSYPFGSHEALTRTLTLMPRPLASTPMPTETGSRSEGGHPPEPSAKNTAGPLVPPPPLAWQAFLLTTCIAMGVWLT